MFKETGRLFNVESLDLCHFLAYFTDDDQKFYQDFPSTDGELALRLELSGSYTPESHIRKRDINNKQLPWLRHEEQDADILAGCTVAEFITTVQRLGGEVYWPVSKIRDFILETE